MLQSSLNSIQSSLRLLGGVADSGSVEESAPAFAAAAERLVGGGSTAVGLAEVEGPSVTVTAAEGEGPGAGMPITGDRAVLVQRALTSEALVSGIVHDGATSRLSMAMRVGPASSAVVFYESVIDPSQPTPQAPGSPFSDLRASLYTSGQADPSQLVLTTETLPRLSGTVERRAFVVGADQWFLVVGARAPLTGSFAHAVPWIILGGGLLAALLVATITEVLARRRTYAQALVAERTDDLQDALMTLGTTTTFLERLVTVGPVVVLRGRDLGSISYASPNIERLWGYTEDEATTAGLIAGLVHPDDRVGLITACERVAEAASTTEDVEFRLRRGEEHRWLSARIVADPNVSGDRQGFFAYLLDVDERRRAEQEARQREAVLEAVFATSPDIIEIGDTTGALRSVSPAIERLLGYRPEEVTSRQLLDLVHPDDRPEIADARQGLLAGEADDISVQYRARHHDGRWVVLESRSAVFDDGTGPKVTVAVIRDVTARAELEEALRAARQAAESANRAKSQFLSRMSHELRTPLNAVLGFGQLLELEELTEHQRDANTHILKAGWHLLDLINEVLDISRIETGDLRLSVEPVLVGELLHAATDMIRPIAAQHGLQIVAAHINGTEETYVLADRQRAQQILLNLLSNAVKYNRVGGTVTVSCLQSDGHVRLNVADTGAGLRPEQLGRLFTPFERLGAEQTTVEGTGIGLVLSRRLAEAMSGSLDVTSIPGEGSTFWVELPIVEGPVERYQRLQQNIADTDEPRPRREDRRVVLHIEDNASNLKLVERILEGRGDIELMAAMQGRLGIDLAREHLPALILLDLHLPDVGGDVILQQLPRRSRHRRDSGGDGQRRRQPRPGPTDARRRRERLPDQAHQRPRVPPLPRRTGTAVNAVPGSVTQRSGAERPARVLVAEDNDALRLLVRHTLEPAGLAVQEACNGVEALELARAHEFDVVLLDLGLPLLDGLDLLGLLRRETSVPVIILSGRDGEADRVAGLELGADDYIVKPFFARELLARVRAVLRRSALARAAGDAERMAFGELIVDRARREVHVGGRPVQTTAREFDLLAFLAARPGRVLSREDLLRSVWRSSSDWQDPATVTELMRRLRYKLDPPSGRPRWISTVRGAGYRFDP